jgi:hypothetical protein
VTTLNLTDYQRHLSDLLAAGRSEEYVSVALPYLQQVPDDSQTRLMASRELIRLGLFGPARELLRPLGAQSELADVLTKLPQQCGHSALAALAPRYEANLKVLQDRGIDVGLIRERWNADRKRYELFIDARGGHQVRAHVANGQHEWVGGITNHPSAAESAPPPPDHKELMPGPYLFDGVGMGWFFERVWRTTRDTFLGYSPALYALIREPAHLALALHLHDWRELLADPRVMLFLGDDAANKFSSLLIDDTDLPLPAFSFAQPLESGRLTPGLTGAITSIASTRSARVGAGLSRIESQYAGRDASYWLRRFSEALSGDGPPLRILASVSTHTTFLQYSMRDAARAARQLGCEFEIISENRPFERIGVSRYHAIIERFEPDLFFAIDHLRTSFINAIPATLPVMTWDQDHLQHIFTEENVRAMQPTDIVVGLPHLECVVRYGQRCEQFLPSHMATSPEEFDSSSLTESEIAPYRCDVSYVSHGSESAEAFHESELSVLTDPNARRLIGALLAPARAAVLAGEPINGLTLRTILADAEKNTGVMVADAAIRDRLVGWHLWRLCDRVFRHQALEWTGQWAVATGRTFRIYGRGWESHPTLSKFSAGVVENGRELLRLYRGSAINLQLMPAGFLHQRALDGLMANSFFMTRRTQADTRDARLPRLVAEIRRRNLASAAELLSSRDGSLSALFHEVRASVGYSEREAEEAFRFALNDACLDYPNEVFQGFEEIVFDSAETFAEKAERFLKNGPLRQRIVNDLRAVVMDRYSCRATMKKFLHHARDYFGQLVSTPQIASMHRAALNAPGASNSTAKTRIPVMKSDTTSI